MPDVGDVVDGYRLDAVIGRGGMGTVYRATDLALEKTVAVKIIAPHLVDDDTFVQRFREEAKALARLDADGIVDVYTMRETEEALFFVMEYIDGPSLQTVLQRRGALAPSQALSLLRQVLEAVQHAHESGVLHRDLKPSNILLDDGQAIITDFGLAKILASDTELTETHDRLGTVAYMSPEQVEGLQNLGEASDLFSVGLIAYEILTGRLPFDRSGSDFIIQRAIVEESFPPPSAYASSIPPALESVVLDLLAKDPADRPPDADSVLQRLPESPTEDEPILEEDPISPRGSTLSTVQWGGLAAVPLLLLAGVYLGVRASLGLPLWSLSAPSPPDTTQETNIAAVPSGPADGPAAPKRGRRPAAAAQDSVSNTRGTSSEERPSGSSAEDDSDPPRTERSSSNSATPSPSDTAAPPPSPPSTDDATSPDPTTRPPLGHLAIRSQPLGATVRVDDSLVGRTPLVLDSLPPATYRVALRRSDHRPLQQTVEVAPNDTTLLTPTLTARPAVVRLQVRPSGTVRIDGGVRPVDTSGTVVDSLAPGAHRVVLTSNRGRWETQLHLEAGEHYTRTVDFTQRVETAVTARTPSGTPLPNATVTVDGAQAGYTPQRLTLRVGQHTIRVEKDGYVPAEREVTVDSDMETPIVFELAPNSE